MFHTVYFLTDVWPNEYESNGYQILEPPHLWYATALTQALALEYLKKDKAERHTSAHRPTNIPLSSCSDATRLT